MRSPVDPIADIAATVAKVVAEHMRPVHELLPKMGLAMAANERTQHKFRTAVLIRLSKIESIVTMILGAQIAEVHLRKPYRDEEKLNKDAEDAETFISQKSNELSLAMVKYIYGESEVPSAQGGRRRKRHG